MSPLYIGICILTGKYMSAGSCEYWYEVTDRNNFIIIYKQITDQNTNKLLIKS